MKFSYATKDEWEADWSFEGCAPDGSGVLNVLEGYTEGLAESKWLDGGATPGHWTNLDMGDCTQPEAADIRWRYALSDCGGSDTPLWSKHRNAVDPVTGRMHLDLSTAIEEDGGDDTRRYLKLKLSLRRG